LPIAATPKRVVLLSLLRASGPRRRPERRRAELRRRAGRAELRQWAELLQRAASQVEMQLPLRLLSGDIAVCRAQDDRRQWSEQPQVGWQLGERLTTAMRHRGLPKASPKTTSAHTEGC
jgi:hypothetical protein